MSNPIRLCVYYSGRVQGVGFRYTTDRLASGFEVTGYVRNLSDGRVELVAEGEESEIQGHLDAIANAMGGNIQHREVLSLEATGEFEGFAIRT